MAIEITGLKEVQQRLEKAPALLVANLFHKALDLSGGIIAAEVESRMEAHGEGELAENVIVKVDVDPVEKSGSAYITFNHTPSERTGKPLDLIALWLEYGHVMTTHSGNTPANGKTHVPAQPVLRPAADATRDRAVEVFTQTPNDGLDEALRSS